MTLMAAVQRKLKTNFSKPSCIVTILSGFVTILLAYILGNPKVGGWFDLHWIPEVIMIFASGYWFGELRHIPLKYLALPFLFGILLPPLLLQNIWAVFITVPLALPFLAGFTTQLFVSRKSKKKQKIACAAWDDAGTYIGWKKENKEK